MTERHRNGRLDGQYDFSVLVTKELPFEYAVRIARDVALRSDAVGVHPVLGGFLYDVWREPEDRYDLKHLRKAHGSVTALSCVMIWDQGILIKGGRDGV